MRTFLTCLSLLIILKCSDSTNSSLDFKSSWELKSDSMNFAILVVDGENYTFEGGNLSYHQKCQNCAADSLPFTLSIELGRNFDNFTFLYSINSDTLFGAFYFFDTNSDFFYYPKFKMPADTFSHVDNKVRMPDSVEYFGHFEVVDSLNNETISVWNAVSNLDIVRDFSQADYSAGLFILPKTSNGREWFIFLCR